MPTRLFQPEGTRLPTSLTDEWGKIPAAVVADLLRGTGHVDAAIRPLRRFGTKSRLVGSAITAQCEGADYGAVHHAINVAEAGDVIVIDAGGRSDAAMIGELLSGSARRKGIAGVVVDGTNTSHVLLTLVRNSLCLAVESSILRQRVASRNEEQHLANA